MATVVLAGTMDSKGLEYAFIRQKLVDTFPECQVLVIDIGYIQAADPQVIVANIGAGEVASKGGCDSLETLRAGTRPAGYKVMTVGLKEIVKGLYNEGKLHGMLGLGGTCGSSMLTAAMRELPIGVPKLLVSTMAGTETAQEYFGISDLVLVNCLTDISGGVNRFNEATMRNAAVSIGSMALDYHKTQAAPPPTEINHKKLVGISMFGATASGVAVAQKRLVELGYDTVIFCAVGTGGRMIEHLSATGQIDGILDISLFEISNDLMSAIHGAGPHRLEQACLHGIPQVLSLGGLDIAAFGPLSTVPEKYRNRKLLVHNEHVTPMRLNPEESTKLAEVVAGKLNKAKGPCQLFIPKGGLTPVSKKGGPLYDAESDTALFGTLKSSLDPKVVEVIEMEEHINDESFVVAMANALHAILQSHA